MTEQVDILDDVADIDQVDHEDQVERPDATGVEQVDAVLDELAAVGSVSPAEQVVVFEQAHASLRRVLDDPGSA